MDLIKITGGERLFGEIQISGSKNSALPLMTATLLTKDSVVLSNIPNLADVMMMAHLLMHHGVSLTLDGSSITPSKSKTILFNAKHIDNLEAPYEIVRKMRASILVLGPLLARFGEAKVSLPGGCAIGVRPVDMHLTALEKMGAHISLEHGYIHATIKGKLQGADIHFDKISVGATENILMAATLAEGTTRIFNAACEPEIDDLVSLLSAMGARISGISTGTLIIEGVTSLHGANHHVIGDRIEAGSYAVAAAITNGELLLKGIDFEMLRFMTEKFFHAGVEIRNSAHGVVVKNIGKKIKSTDVTTQAYPGFATDMQAQFMTLMTIASGVSVINETIFENRFMHVAELTRMGADISLNGHSATIKGVKKLIGTKVMATDLRASMSLVIAGLIAEGETCISRVYHIDRGYENIEEKLSNCGAIIARVPAYALLRG